MSLTIVRRFGAVSLQGARRPGLRCFGVPVGGAFDQESLVLANALVGMDPVAPALELSMAHVEFKAERSGLVSFVGAVAQVFLNGSVATSNRSFAVASGDVLEVAAPTRGARVYVAFGEGPEMSLAEPPSSIGGGQIPAVIGPQANRVCSPFEVGRLSVSQQSNRMGIRLDGSSAAHRLELPSEPQCPGTIQVTPDGTLIVIGPDGPTIGGYPKAAVVATAAIDRVGQLRPGDGISFLEVDIEGARQLLVRDRARLTDLRNSISVAGAIQRLSQ